MEKFSAPEQSLGYHYQIRYSLYLLLRERERTEVYVTLEKLDDVEIGDVDRQDLYQTKFHQKGVANLSDKSVDLWKTIRVWSESIKSETIDLENTLFVLVTTANTSPNSIAFEFTKGKLDFKATQEIVKTLDDISLDSSNKSLEASFNAYNELSSNQKRKLVERIFIKDDSLNFSDLKDKIRKELEFFLRPNQSESAFNDLQGWWYEQCIQHLESQREKISYAELNEKIIEINYKFVDDNLPIDEIIRDAQPNKDEYDTRVFVSQLRLVNVGKNSIVVAIRDYYRASEQRSKWLREKLLNPQEEIRYEKELKDDWKTKFALLEDEYEELDENLCTERCRDFYTAYYVKSHPQIFIRPRVQESFIIRGSCQMLADKKEIGWRPNYLELLD